MSKRSWASPPTSHIISLRLWTKPPSPVRPGGEKGTKTQPTTLRLRRCAAPSTTYRLTVVLPSGKERDDAPMLYIGEELGSMIGVAGAPRIDIAVDPLECTNNCADDQPNSIAVLATATWHPASRTG